MFSCHPQRLEALSINRQRLLAALITAQITEVLVRYEGGGDEGDVSELVVEPASCLSTLQSSILDYSVVRSEYREETYHYFLVEKSLSLEEALRDFAFTWLDVHHGGWENNEGGAGVMTIRVADDHFLLEHVEYYTESSDYTYSL